MEELECVLKQMKRNKCPGDDEIAAEVLMYAGEDLKNNMLKMYNWFFKHEAIPEELTKIIIKSIYKGKGETTELKNHRGVFISSAILKIYEKLKMNRIYPIMEKEGFSEYQAGARKNHAIQDQLFTLYTLIDQARYLNNKLYLEFLDLIKAFDKMVLKCVMNDLWRMNIKGRIWRNIFIINQKSTVKIRSSVGITDKIEVGEILKQGSVLASCLASAHTDTINKMFNRSDLGKYYGEVHIPNLLFQDDIIRIEETSENLNKANSIIKPFQEINRMKFHEEKTVCMIINSRKECKENITLDGRKVKMVEEYKYLGDVVTANGKYNRTIQERENGITGMTAELSNIISETSGLEIKAILQFMKQVILPKLTLNTETWNQITKENMKHMERIQAQAVKRLLKIPYTTPTQGLNHELGLYSIENQILEKRLMFLHRVIKEDNATLCTRMMKEQLRMPGETWMKNTVEMMEEVGIDFSLEEVASAAKEDWKRRVKYFIKEKEEKEFEDYKLTSRKCRKIETYVGMKQYLKDMEAKDSMVIMMARLGMTNIRVNYKNKYDGNTKCQQCQENEEETLLHLLNCGEKNNSNFFDDITEIYSCSPNRELLTKVANRITFKLSAKEEASAEELGHQADQEPDGCVHQLRQN